MVLIIIHFICLNQLGKYQVKYINVYIEPFIDEILKWNHSAGSHTWLSTGGFPAQSILLGAEPYFNMLVYAS